MKPPKNFYSNLDRRKQGLPEVPEASAADAGKIIKVGEDGAYELEPDSSLPSVSVDNNGSILQVINGSWQIMPLGAGAVLYNNNSRAISSTPNIGIRCRVLDGTTTYYRWGAQINVSALSIAVADCNMPVALNINGTMYYGFTSAIVGGFATAIVYDANNIAYSATLGNTLTITPLGSVRYFEIEVSGSSVSLPSGVTFADVYAELQAGVDVKFTSGARVYSVTSFESTNIRAHWMSDLDLTNIEVYVINLASDGTGTVASATFSGS